MEEQATGLAEMVGNDTQLKELYDSLEQEDKSKEEEFKKLVDEMNQINSYLDSFGIPREKDNKKLSTLERLSIHMNKAA